MNYSEILDKLKDERLYAEKNYVPIIREKSAKFLYDFIGLCGKISISIVLCAEGGD